MYKFTVKHITKLNASKSQTSELRWYNQRLKVYIVWQLNRPTVEFITDRAVQYFAFSPFISLYQHHECYSRPERYIWKRINGLPRRNPITFYRCWFFCNNIRFYVYTRPVIFPLALIIMFPTANRIWT